MLAMMTSCRVVVVRPRLVLSTLTWAVLFQGTEINALHHNYSCTVTFSLPVSGFRLTLARKSLILVGREGIEPSTNGLRVHCSAN